MDYLKLRVPMVFGEQSQSSVQGTEQNAVRYLKFILSTQPLSSFET